MSIGTRADRKLDLLRHVPLFSACSDAELRKIARLADETTVGEGEVIVREGDTGRACFVIASGEAAVTLSGDELATLGPGSVFGEMALLDHRPRSATVTALTAMTLLVISPVAFTSMLAEHGTVARQVLEGLARRLRRTEGGPTW